MTLYFYGPRPSFTEKPLPPSEIMSRGDERRCSAQKWRHCTLQALPKRTGWLAVCHGVCVGVCVCVRARAGVCACACVGVCVPRACVWIFI